MALPEQRKSKSSIFPDFPRHAKAVEESGRFTPMWHLSLSSLYQALQSVFSNEGYLIPPITEQDADTIQAIYTPLIGKTLNFRKPPIPNISGQMAYITNPTVSGSPVPPVPKMFIIEFTIPTDPTSVIVAASWKTFTLT